MLEGGEVAGTGSVVFEVVGADVEVAEELCGDAVVAAFGEVARVNEVA